MLSRKRMMQNWWEDGIMEVVAVLYIHLFAGVIVSPTVFENRVEKWLLGEVNGWKSWI